MTSSVKTSDKSAVMSQVCVPKSENAVTGTAQTQRRRRKATWTIKFVLPANFKNEKMKLMIFRGLNTFTDEGCGVNPDLAQFVTNVTIAKGNRRPNQRRRKPGVIRCSAINLRKQRPKPPRVPGRKPGKKRVTRKPGRKNTRNPGRKNTRRNGRKTRNPGRKNRNPGRKNAHKPANNKGGHRGITGGKRNRTNTQERSAGNSSFNTNLEVGNTKGRRRQNKPRPNKPARRPQAKRNKATLRCFGLGYLPETRSVDEIWSFFLTNCNSPRGIEMINYNVRLSIPNIKNPTMCLPTIKKSLPNDGDKENFKKSISLLGNIENALETFKGNVSEAKTLLNAYT